MSELSDGARLIRGEFLSCNVHRSQLCNVENDGKVTDCHCDRSERLDAATLAIDTLVKEAERKGRVDAQREMIERAGEFEIERVTPEGPIRLWVDNQGFTIQSSVATCEEERGVPEWYAQMLGLALTALVNKAVAADRERIIKSLTVSRVDRALLSSEIIRIVRAEADNSEENHDTE